MEAVNVRWFCSEDCRKAGESEISHERRELGNDNEWPDGTCCYWCTAPLMRTHDTSDSQHDWTSIPTHCPFCGGDRNVESGFPEWIATSTEDNGNTATLTEYQCHSGICEGRSFWA